MTVSISHKKFREIMEGIYKYVREDEEREELYNFMREILKYKEDRKYKYDKEKYEKYMKPYVDKNRKEISEKMKNRYRVKKGLDIS